LLAIEGAVMRECRDSHATFVFSADIVSASELICRIAASCPIRDVSIAEPNIEEIVARIYQDTSSHA
jgi:ABC-type uncharacterized transport system ATPase subunit